ncbi:MAG: LuxR C-terminal-related transcriptional regulator [Chloroflexota bacterium]
MYSVASDEPPRIDAILGHDAKQWTKEIAATLVISPLTVRTHTTNIYQKLNVTNRRQAVMEAQTLGLLPTRQPYYNGLRRGTLWVSL